MKNLIQLVRNFSLGTGFGVIVLLGTASAAHATTYNITTGSACTLSAAITASNTASTSGSCAAGSTPNTINLAAGTYTLGADLPNIATNDLSVAGAGVGATLIDGQNLYNALISNGGGITVNFSNLSIARAGGTSGQSMQTYIGNVQNVVLRDSTAVGGINVGSGTVSNVAVLNTKSTGHAFYITASGGVTTVNNVTVSGNGEGIFVAESATSTVTITNATIAGNNNLGGSPAGFTRWVLAGSSTVKLTNTILSNNASLGTSSNCGTGTLGGSPMMLPTSGGGNISSDATCNAAFAASGDKNSTNSLLGALVALNGTYVLPITYSSPAYNNAAAGAPGSDQAGTVRPQCGASDSGAYETTGCTPAPAASGGSTSAGTTQAAAAKTPTVATAAKAADAPPAAADTKAATPPATAASTSSKLAAQNQSSTKVASSHLLLYVTVGLVFAGLITLAFIFRKKLVSILARF